MDIEIARAKSVESFVPLLLQDSSRNQSHGQIVVHSEIADEKAEFNFIAEKDNQTNEFMSDNLIKNENAERFADNIDEQNSSESASSDNSNEKSLKENKVVLKEKWPN